MSKPLGLLSTIYYLFFLVLDMLRISNPSVLRATQSHLARQRVVAFKRFNSTNNAQEPVTIYTGPLANVAKKLKLFSITSLGLGVGISPFVFAIDVPVPFVAKAALVGAGKSFFFLRNDKSQ